MSNVRAVGGRAIVLLGLLAASVAVFAADAPGTGAVSQDPSIVCPPPMPPFLQVPCFDLDDKNSSTPIDEDSKRKIDDTNEHLRDTRGGNWGLPSTVPSPGSIESLEVPANLRVTPGDLHLGMYYLDISWSAVDGAKSYDVQAQEAGSSSWHSVASVTTGTSHRYTTDKTIDHVRVRARNTSGTSDWTQVSRMPAADWLNTAQFAGGASASSSGGASASGGASIASGGSIAAQLSAPTWGTITRSYDATHRSGRIDVNWTGVSNATGYSLVCAVAGSTPASTGWNWHPCGWIDATDGTVKFTTVPADASQPVGIVSYKRGAESSLPPGIIPLEGGQAALAIPRMYAVSIRAVSATPSEASAWAPSASIKPLNPQLSNLTWTRTDSQITLRWTPNPWTTGYEIDCATYDSTQSPYSPSYTRCATLTNQDHSASEHSVAISTWTAGGTNYAIDNTSTYDIRICSTNTWGRGCHLAPLISPNTLLTASNVTMTTATLTIAHHTGNWYYKHTGAGATCDGPVTGTSKALTSLSAGATYTFSAYSDSTCSTRLAVATSFSTSASVSNLTSTKGSILSEIQNTRTGAQAFSTGSNANGYVLTKVILPLKNVSATSTNLVITLHAMKAEGTYTKNSEPASTALATLSGTAPTSNAWTDTTYTCSGSGCTLSPNTTYFVKAVYAQTGYYEWAYTDGDDSIEVKVPSDNGWDLLYDHYGTGGVWRSYEDQYLAEIVFENVPNPELTASDIGATTATLNIAHHTGNWYHKHTGAGATCEGPVSGTSKDLTGLTAGATYSYSAYSDSACSTLLATATGFATHFSVSSLTSTKDTTLESQIHSNLSAAVAFTTGPNAGGYVLRSVTAPLKHTGGTNGVIFQLTTMEGTGQYSSTSQASSTILATLSTATPTASTYTDTTVTCSGSGCRLSANTTYFIVASNVDVAPSYSWAVSKSETEIALPSDNGWSIGFGHSKQGARESIWSSYSDWNPVEIVFTPNPGLTSSNVAATTATLTIANHAGQWWYKHTNTGATCDGPVAAGTSSVNLTGLTAGTAYTYSAYSDSGCTTGNLLATAAQFTTLVDKASVSNLDETVVGLHTVQTGASHAQEFTTGNTTGVYKLTKVTVNFTLVTNAAVVTVAIHDKQSNGTPATTARATLSGTPANGKSEFTCSGSGCDLDAETSYFVYVSVNASIASYPSSTASDDQTLVPTGTGWSIANAARSQNGNWAELANGQSMQIKVEATVEAKLTSSSITATGATLTIGGHTGQWWYKHTNTGATCQGPVAAGTSTKALTGLTSGTNYTYSAYSKSGCNSADLLATAAAFTTP